jgi:ribosomal protein S18 acetylase RimI-like enzyme
MRITQFRLKKVMISISKATEDNYKSIVEIGQVSVAEAHRNSCSDGDLNEYIQKNYNDDAIRAEVHDTKNIYHIISYNGEPVGFSKIMFNAKHSNVAAENVAKLDRIYLLKAFHGLRLGFELLNFNISLSRRNNQVGLWLYTWIGNEKAINFYSKVGFKIIGSHMFNVTETASNLNHQMLLDLPYAKKA